MSPAGVKILDVNVNQTAAVWYDAGSSRRVAATLQVGNGALLVRNDGGETRHALLADVRVSSRLGDLPRRLQLPDGVVLTVADNDFIDRAFSRRHSSVLHGLESRWRWMAALTAVAALVVAVSYQYLLPSAADTLAEKIPSPYLRDITASVYNQLHEREVLHATELSAKQQQRAQRLFALVADDYAAPGFDLRLLSHRLFFDLPNAFALPDGMIIVTDEAARLLNDDELIAVFAHEVGHVVRRHSMRSLVRIAGLTSVVFFLLGDFSGLSLVPIYAAQLQYSRDFEREADCFAYAYLKRNDMSLTLIGEALLKMEGEMERVMAERSGEDDEDGAVVEEAGDDNVDGAGDEGAVKHGGEADDEEGKKEVWLKLIEALSTHPQTEERMDLSGSCDADGNVLG